MAKPFKPSRYIKGSFYIHENRLDFPRTKGFRLKISINLVYQYMAIFFNVWTTSNHLRPLQVENRDRNSRLVVHEYKNGKFRLERIKGQVKSPELPWKKVIIRSRVRPPSHWLVMMQYCGDPPWQKGSLLGLIPWVFKFCIACL